MYGNQVGKVGLCVERRRKEGMEVEGSKQESPNNLSSLNNKKGGARVPWLTELEKLDAPTDTSRSKPVF